MKMSDSSTRHSRDLRDRERDRDRRDRHDRDGGEGNRAHTVDDPPNSRLFVVCGKSLKEEDFREAFSKFGTIEEVWIVRDRQTGDPKGVVYIKFSKTSEAAKAMEEMNGKVVGDSVRPLKVLIAHSRDQGSRREVNEDERLVRLFVVVPRDVSEADMKAHFEQFGNLEYSSIIKDKLTKESKGFGFVKFRKMYNAALAFENCDRAYKPVFAEPKPAGSSARDSRDGRNGPMELYTSPSSGMLSQQHYPSSSHPIPHHQTPSLLLSNAVFDGMPRISEMAGGNKLLVIASPNLNQDQLWKLFDIAPGLDYCDMWRKPGQTKNYGVAVYNNPQSASYALQKLHGFEYPPGERLIVKYDTGAIHGGESGVGMGGMVGAYGSSHNGHAGRDRAVMPAPLVQPMQIEELKYDPSYCSVALPPPQPLAPLESNCAARLFIVCSPSPPPPYVLKDVFGRFGNLIDVYMLHGKNCGYVKYSQQSSADHAIEILHGQEIHGCRLKVMEADPRASDSGGGGQERERKRLRLNANEMSTTPPTKMEKC